MRKYIPYVVAVIFALLYITKPTTNTVIQSPVTITADHLVDTSKLGEKIYSDSSRDYAIYYNKDFKHKKPNIGDKMYLEDLYLGIVSKIDDSSFQVTLEDPTVIEFGMSGKYVTDRDGVSYGFISSFKSDTLYVIMF